MNKAVIFVYTHATANETGADATDRYEVDNYEIDDGFVIAKMDDEKWIFPLSSIYAIEVLN